MRRRKFTYVIFALPPSNFSGRPFLAQHRVGKGAIAGDNASFGWRSQCKRLDVLSTEILQANLAPVDSATCSGDTIASERERSTATGVCAIAAGVTASLRGSTPTPGAANRRPKRESRDRRQQQPDRYALDRLRRAGQRRGDLRKPHGTHPDEHIRDLSYASEPRGRAPVLPLLWRGGSNERRAKDSIVATIAVARADERSAQGAAPE